MMKKMLKSLTCLAMALAMVLSVAACAAPPSGNSQQSAAPTPATPAEAPSAAPQENNEPIKIGLMIPSPAARCSQASKPSRPAR